MRNMLKVTAAVLAVMMVFMSACSQKDAEVSSPSPEPTVIATPTTSPEASDIENDAVVSESGLERLELDVETLKELNIFMSAFLEEGFTYYYSDYRDELKLLSFAIARAQKENPDEIKKAEKTLENLMDFNYTISQKAVDGILLKYFNINDYDHRTVDEYYYFDSGMYYIKQPEKSADDIFAYAYNTWGNAEGTELVINVYECYLDLSTLDDKNVVYDPAYAEEHQEDIRFGNFGAADLSIIKEGGKQRFALTRLDVNPL